jgi:hypothetical protein
MASFFRKKSLMDQLKTTLAQLQLRAAQLADKRALAIRVFVLHPRVCFRGEADVNRTQGLTESVVNDPEPTNTSLRAKVWG